MNVENALRDIAAAIKRDDPNPSVDLVLEVAIGFFRNQERIADALEKIVDAIPELLVRL